MSDKESAQNVIEAYRKRQQRSQKAPLFLAIAALLLIVGAAVLIFWLTGSGQTLFAPKPTDTSTPTVTFTATLAPTATNTSTVTPTLAPTDTPTPTETPTPSGPFEYTVQENDTLSSIAEKFGTDLPTLLALNPNIDPTTLLIRVGDKILIPAPDTHLPTATAVSTGLPAGTIVEYTIVSGDTLEAVAARFLSTVAAIVEENDLENANDIRAGDILRIPVNLVTPVPTATVGTIFPTANLPTNTPAVTDTAAP